MKSLLWWVNALPTVLDDYCVSVIETDPLAQAVKHGWWILVRQPNGIRLSAEVCSHFDKWLEDPANTTGGVLEDPMAVYVCDAVIRLADAYGNSPKVVKAIRTLLVGLKKWAQINDMDHAGASSNGTSQRDPRDAEAVAKFIQTQEDLKTVNLADERLVMVLAKAKTLIAQVLADAVPPDDESGARIGPGAVFEGFNAFEKWDDIHRHPCSMDCFHVLPESQNNQDAPPKLRGSSCIACNRTARLTAVPKDLWRKRLISVEPNVLQFRQQQIRQCFVDAMAKHPLTRHLFLHDQGQQQRLATWGSRSVCAEPDSVVVELPAAFALLDHDENSDWADSKPATLDFADASDRVSWNLIQVLIPMDWLWILGSIRSTHVQDGKKGPLVALQTYAGMGNATTFCVETLVFWAVTAAYAMLFYPGTQPAWIARHVSVYGDDVIIPGELAEHSRLFEVYKLLGWRLNSDKSFFRSGGLFRESCGVHAYNGHDVTPQRIAGYDTKTIEGKVALAQKMKQLSEDYPTLTGEIHRCSQVPNGLDASNTTWTNIPYLPVSPLPPVRWNKAMQQVEFFVATPTPHKRRTKKSGQGLLLAWACGFSYVTWNPTSLLDRSRMAVKAFRPELGEFDWTGRNKPYFDYVATVPRRVSETTRWLPTTTGGLDGDPAAILERFLLKLKVPRGPEAPLFTSDLREISESAVRRSTVLQQPLK